MRLLASADPTSPLRITLPRVTLLRPLPSPLRLETRTRSGFPHATHRVRVPFPRLREWPPAEAGAAFGSLHPSSRGPGRPRGVLRLASEWMPRPAGTCGHGPPCSLPSVVDRRWPPGQRLEAAGCNEDDRAPWCCSSFTYSHYLALGPFHRGHAWPGGFPSARGTPNALHRVWEPETAPGIRTRTG